MQRYKLPALEDSHILADQIKKIYIQRKETKKQQINQNRLVYIDLLHVLSLAPWQNGEGYAETLTEDSFENIVEDPSEDSSVSLAIGREYAHEAIYTLATADFVGSITAPVETDEAVPNINHKFDELKAALLIFLEENISRKEYRGHSSKRRKGYVYTSGSDLSKIIEEKLAVSSDNVLRDEERFIYLSDLYYYIKDHIHYEELNHPIWKSKQNLLNDICLAMSQVKKRDEERVRLLTHGAPKLNMLLNYIEELHETYNEACKLRLFTNSNRKNLLKFVQFISKACESSFNIEKGGDDNYEETYKAILGLLLLGIMQINAEYKYFFSPQGGYLNKGSELFKSLIKLLNVEDLNEIPYDDRIEWFRALTNKISNVKKAEMQELRMEWLKEIAEPSGDATPLQKLDEKILKKTASFQEKIDFYVNQLQREKRQSSFPARCLAKGISFGAQYGIGCALASQVMPLLGGVAAGVLGGPVGVVVYAAAGTVLMTKLSGIIPGPVSWAYGWVLDKIGTAIGDTTVNVVKYTFSVGKNGLQMLLGHPGLKPEDREFMQRYIDAILNAPVRVVSEEEKSQLRLVLGIEENKQSLTMMRSLA